MFYLVRDEEEVLDVLEQVDDTGYASIFDGCVLLVCDFQKIMPITEEQAEYLHKIFCDYLDYLDDVYDGEDPLELDYAQQSFREGVLPKISLEHSDVG